MDPIKKLANLANPSYVTGKIVSWLTKLCKLAVLDFSKFVLRKLSGRLLGLPDPFRLPRRYKLPSFTLAVLGTIFFWGGVLGLFLISSEVLTPVWLLCTSVLFYGFALLVLVAHRRGAKNMIMATARRLKLLINKLKKIYKIWFP